MKKLTKECVKSKALIELGRLFSSIPIRQYEDRKYILKWSRSLIKC